MDYEISHDLYFIKESKAYEYARRCVDGDNKRVSKYVKAQCRDFLNMVDNYEDSKYYISEDEYNKLCRTLGLINIMPRKTALDNLAGFQWFFLVNIFCIRRKDNGRRRFQYSVLLIGRKNGKSLLSSLILLILMITGERNSEFYSCAPDKELSSMVKKEMEKLIDNSPKIRHHFKPVKSETRCLPTSSKYVPLAFSENRMDGRLATGYVVDEVGALKNNYPIVAMQSSQITLEDKFGVLISTAYQTLDNPMTSEVSYCKKVLDGLIEDDKVFCLLFEPDNAEEWYTDESLYQANPLAQEVDVIRDALLEARQKAIDMPENMSNFKTKHLNIFLDGNEDEVFVTKEELQQGLIQSYDWYGREVYLGVDLSKIMDTIIVIL